MSPATLPRFPALDLDFRRIAGTSATIAVHVLAFMLLLSPMQQSAPIKLIEVDKPYVPVDEKEPEPIRPVPVEPRPVTRTEPSPRTPPMVMEQLERAPVDEVVDNAEQVDTDTGDFGGTGTDFEVVEPSGPQKLAILLGPSPTYPIQALRQGIQGRVILRIEVDAAGVPTGGRIETSSGSSLLDRAALRFVIAKWRFAPAMSAGQPTSATALVPVDFVINQ